MIFCHIIDNFVLTNKLEVMKQKLWWEDTCAKDGLHIILDILAEENLLKNIKMIIKWHCYCTQLSGQ